MTASTVRFPPMRRRTELEVARLTGGVTQTNMHDYLGLPSVFCCGGTWLVPADALARADYAAVEALARAAVEAL